MSIVEIHERDTKLIQELVSVWECSVRATHLFLMENDIENIKAYVPDALSNVAHLVIAKEEDSAIAFMGVEDRRLEMLFVSADKRGKSKGKQLLEYGIREFHIDTLTVNEQNPQALGFYQKFGFEVSGRSETDEQGNPFPILLMKRITK